MAEIHPFRGIRYNEQSINNLGAVICPPYDVISPEEQKAYYERSEYNIIRLEYAMELPGDVPGNNKHTRAATTLTEWLNKGILKRDNAPALYIYEQHFTYRGARKKRLGFICCVRLEPWGSKVIQPHENTVAGIKSDRLELMRACRANISPILALYDDPGQKVAQLLSGQTRKRLVLDFTSNSENHKIWIVTDWEFIQRVSNFIASKPLYIADGHHRYETALAYQKERQKQGLSGTGDEAFNFIMMNLVSFSDPGIFVLPVHRLVRGIPSSVLNDFKHKLEGFFSMESVAVNHLDSPLTEGKICVLGLEADKAVVLRLRPGVSIQEIMPEDRSEAYGRLGVSLFQHLILERLLGGSARLNIGYTHSIEIAKSQIENKEYQLAFILSPIPVEMIQAIADSNDRMPGKSTYFYPKLPTGLVINPLIGEL